MLAHQPYDDLRGEIHRVTRGNRSEAAQSRLLIRRTMIYGGRYSVSHGEPFRGGPILLAHQAYDDLQGEIHRVTRRNRPEAAQSCLLIRRYLLREIHSVTRGNHSDAAQSCLLIRRTMIYGGRYTE